MLYKFQEGIKRLLEENEEITWDVYDYVLETATSPFIVIGDDRATIFKTKTQRGKDITTTINVWAQSRSMLGVKKIIDLIEETLTRDFEHGEVSFQFQEVQSVNVGRESIELVLGTIEITYRGVSL